MSPLPWLLLAAPAAIPAVITGINLLTWTRGRANTVPEGRVSILIPARNEETTIEACVEAALAGPRCIDEVIVYNDASTDATSDILARLERKHPRLRIVEGHGLPAGWVGKPHACHQLAQHATGDVLVFVDADTTLTPDGIPRLLDLLSDSGLVTAFPRQHTHSLAEQLLMPLLCLTYTAWLPLALIPRTTSPHILAANGQVVAVRRNALEALGGFASVRGEVVDDMALCRQAKRSGIRVCFADGYAIAECRMYNSASEIWSGFSKNLYEGIGESTLALLGVVALYLLTMVLPFVALPLSLLVDPAWMAPAAVGVGLNLLTRSLLALRYGHTLLSVLLHPLAVLGLLAIAVNSARWSRLGAIEWRGRTYASRGNR
ncbi:MAG: chlorobactene glucosyltransferase [Myxococcota bacterium]|jgi:chlorobactene glucosyltransferase